MTKSALALLLSLALFAPACSGDDPGKMVDDAHASLGRSDYQGALQGFQAALAKLDPSSPDYVSAKMGEIEAWTYIDGAKAKDEFLALATSKPGDVNAKDYRRVASNLTSAKKFGDAIAVLEQGLKTYPEDQDVKRLGDTIKAEAQKAGDSEALDRLKGLGYL